MHSSSLTKLIDSCVRESLTLQEKIRSDTFDLAVFKGLKSHTGRLKYVRDNLAPLAPMDAGSSRAVFLLSSRKVLKIALLNIKKPEAFKRGVAQNKAEVENASLIPNLVTKVFDQAPDYTWIVSELVKPLTNDSQFPSLVGFHFGTLMMFFHDAYKDRFNVDQFQARFKGTKSVFDDIQRMREWPAFKDVLTTLKNPEKGLHPGDFSVLDHWGKTADGRVVLLDSGATYEVLSAHYGLYGESILDVLKGKQEIDPSLSHSQQQLLVLSQSILGSLQGLYDTLEQSRVQLVVIEEIRKEVEEKAGKKLPIDTATNFSQVLSSLSQGAIVEYQDYIKKAVIQQQLSPQQPTISESLTLPTIASFTFGAARNMSGYLETLEELARHFKAHKLLRGLKIAGMVTKKIESRGNVVSFDDQISIVLYKALWDKGFQSSKIFLSDSDYLSGAENARLLTEGLFYKLNLGYYAFGSIQSLLSISVAYLKETEGNREAEGILNNIHNKLVGSVAY